MPKPLDVIRTECMRYPGAKQAFLFDGSHEVYRIKDKVFVWLGDGEAPGSTYVSVKLKDTQSMALQLPFVKPASYGMAKWGWVGAEFPKGKFPEPLVREWIYESWRHTAPKKLLKEWEAKTAGAAPVKKPAKKQKK
ncbi:MAG: MmcQ/YjbR family DNA-binding protein [Myxococcaceae bacterium]|nr:MmcQ/YjbR family DNA-binding protein [Myxococcaceae bacterium]